MKNTNDKVYVTKIIKEGDDLAMLFQQDLLTEMQFEEDSLWQWIPQPNGTIILNKVGSTTPTS